MKTHIFYLIIVIMVLSTGCTTNSKNKDISSEELNNSLESVEEQTTDQVSLAKEEEKKEDELEKEKQSKALEGYIFPNSSKEYIEPVLLEKLSPEEMRIARNEIFARHGYVFKDKELQQYFEEKTWYVPGSDNNSIVLSDIEIHNVDLIKSYEPNEFVPLDNYATGYYLVIPKGINEKNELVISGFYKTTLNDSFDENATEWKLPNGDINVYECFQLVSSKEMAFPIPSVIEMDECGWTEYINFSEFQEIVVRYQDKLKNGLPPKKLFDILVIELDKGQLVGINHQSTYAG